MPVAPAEPELLPTITTGTRFRVVSKDGTATVFIAKKSYSTAVCG